MDERSQWFNDQLAPKLLKQAVEKTEQRKLSWTTAFEDGQFKAILPNGELALVVQVKGDLRRFLVLDNKQETLLDETITKAETESVPAHHPKLVRYLEIGKLQELARGQALLVNEKLIQAEKLLAAI